MPDFGDGPTRKLTESDHEIRFEFALFDHLVGHGLSVGASF
jgi:hypothetical protein